MLTGTTGNHSSDEVARSSEVARLASTAGVTSLATAGVDGLTQWRGERYDGTSTRTGPLQSKK